MVEKEFIGLIKNHQGILQKICNIYFIRNPYKEDYYQEILIRLWKSYPSFKNQSTFSTWLYRVALNTAIDIIRKQYLQPVHTELSKTEYNIPDPENNVGSDKKDILYQAISHLSDVDKAIIFLYLSSILIVVNYLTDIGGVKNLSCGNQVLPVPLLGILILMLLIIPWFIKYEHNQRYKKLYSNLNESARHLDYASGSI